MRAARHPARARRRAHRGGAARARARGAAGAAAAHRADRRRRSRRGAMGARSLMTSANAARALARASAARASLLALPVFAVGRRTAEAARAAGFADVDIGRRRRAAISRGCRGAPRRRAAAAPLSRRRGSRRRSGGRRSARTASRSAPSWSTAPSRPTAFPAAARTALAHGRHRRRAAFFPPQRRGLSRLRQAADLLDQALAPGALLPVGAGGRAAAAAGAAESGSRRGPTRQR